MVQRMRGEEGVRECARGLAGCSAPKRADGGVSISVDDSFGADLCQTCDIIKKKKTD